MREVTGIAAYRAGKWAEALAELRTARRLTGDASYLPMMADSERALGRLDRALALIDGPGARDANRATQIELLIVASGIRRDQGRPAAGVSVLQVPELTDGRLRPWSARLFYAYADALLDAERDEEAREWFARAAAVDTDEETDAAQRYEELDSVLIEDLTGPDDDAEPDDPDPDDPDPDVPDSDDPDSGEPDSDDPEPDDPEPDDPDPDDPDGGNLAADDVDTGDLDAGDLGEADHDAGSGQPPS